MYSVYVVGYQGIPGLLFLVCELQMVFYMIVLLVNVKKKKNYNLSQGSSIAVHISLVRSMSLFQE